METIQSTLKEMDLFSKPVELKLKPGKKGGKATPMIGSVPGFLLSVLVVFILIQMGFFKHKDMKAYRNIRYSSLNVRNKFTEGDEHDESELNMADFDFMPSIDYFLMNTEVTVA